MLYGDPGLVWSVFIRLELTVARWASFDLLVPEAVFYRPLDYHHHHQMILQLLPVEVEALDWWAVYGVVSQRN